MHRRRWVLFLLFASVTGIVPARSSAEEADGPQWIWFNEGDPAKEAPAGTRYFRKAFAVGRFAEEALLDITADAGYTVWVNGVEVGRSDDWKTVRRYDVRKQVIDGKNVIAIEARHPQAGPAGVLVRLIYAPNGNAKRILNSDDTWAVSTTAAEGWQKPEFDDRSWRWARTLGPVGKVGPWKDLTWEGGSSRFRVPEGFRVEQAVKTPASDKTFSLINICFDAKGRLLVSRENGPVLLCTDPDEHGVYRGVQTYCDQVRNCQGMCWVKDALLLVGNGPNGTGLYRCRDANGQDRIDEVELVHKFKGPMGEHGPHAILHGPDDKLYLLTGNHAWAQPDTLAANSPLTRWPTGNMGPDQGQPNTTEDVLLPRLNDALGHAADKLAPGGTIWRMDQDGKNMALVNAGFRNHFDAAFAPNGELFTFDSDMEWDEGLPWYRPVRVVHCPPGGDFVWRTGAANTPSYYIDSLPPIAETGRGSPVGMEFYDHTAFPEKYRGALFLGDWSIGVIWVVHLERNGASYLTKPEKFCTGAPLNVTDLTVGPDGAIYFTMGGRNTQGGVYRIVATAKPSHDANGHAVQPLAPWSPGRDAVGNLPDLKVLYAESRDSDPEVRARVTEQLGRIGGPDVERALIAALKDADPLVRRRACEALIRAGIEPPVEALKPLFTGKDRFLRTAARLVLQRIDPKKWAAAFVADGDDTVAEEAIIALCKTNQLEPYTETVFERLRGAVDPKDVTAFLNYLRTIQMALVHSGARPIGVKAIAERCFEQFPQQDPSVNRELAILLTGLRREGQTIQSVHAKLLAALLASPDDRQQQIHYFYCLRLLHEGWTHEQKAELLHWFDSTQTWRGGASFAPYLDNILKDLMPVFTADDLTAVVRAGVQLPWASRALLKWAKPEQLPPAAVLIELYAKLRESEMKIAKAAELRNALVAAVARVSDPEVQPFLRQLADSDAALRDTVAHTLAKYPTAENFPYVLKGLESSNPLVVSDVVPSLARNPATPKADDPAPWRALLKASAKLGEKQRWQAVEVLRHWSGGKQFGAEKDQAREELDAWVLWFDQTFPKEPPIARGGALAGAASRYDFKELLTFLEKDPAGKNGDAVRGKLVFTKALCIKCHKYGNEGEGIGPDLTTLSKRFKRSDTLESILYPSKVIADQYRSTTVVTKKGQQLIGLAAPVGDTVTVVLNDATKVTLKKDEIESQYASLVSVMPEKLLDPLTKEEIADLFAYLESEPAK